MIPRTQYRQRKSSHAAFPRYKSQESDQIFILEKDGIGIQNVENNHYTFVAYSDMQTIRLDCEYWHRKGAPDFHQFLCHINQDITIKTAWLLQEKDIEYNKFIKMLHAKLQAAPSETRTFHTGLTENSYNSSSFLRTIFWIIVILLGVASGSFGVFWFIFLGILLVFEVHSTMNSKPTTYLPNSIPAHFLS